MFLTILVGVASTSLESILSASLRIAATSSSSSSVSDGLTSFSWYNRLRTTLKRTGCKKQSHLCPCPCPCPCPFIVFPSTLESLLAPSLTPPSSCHRITITLHHALSRWMDTLTCAIVILPSPFLLPSPLSRSSPTASTRLLSHPCPPRSLRLPLHC